MRNANQKCSHHYGHEAIFKYILSNFDILYLNPIYGIKKKMIFQIYIFQKLLNLLKKNIRMLNLILYGQTSIMQVRAKLFII